MIFFLFFSHLSTQRKKKALKFDIVIVGNKKVSHSAMSIQPILNIIHVELSNVESAHTFHDIFLNTTSCSHDAIDHFMLSQVANDVSHST